MNNLSTDELDATAPEQQLEIAESELKAALIFAKFSSSSYTTGNLQHAADARSKAKVACARAARRLAAPEIIQVSTDSVKLILTEVQSALADLHTPRAFSARVRGAGN